MWAKVGLWVELARMASAFESRAYVFERGSVSQSRRDKSKETHPDCGHPLNVCPLRCQTLGGALRPKWRLR